MVQEEKKLNPHSRENSEEEGGLEGREDDRCVRHRLESKRFYER